MVISSEKKLVEWRRIDRFRLKRISRNVRSNETEEYLSDSSFPNRIRLIASPRRRHTYSSYFSLTNKEWRLRIIYVQKKHGYF